MPIEAPQVLGSSDYEVVSKDIKRGEEELVRNESIGRLRKPAGSLDGSSMQDSIR